MEIKKSIKSPEIQEIEKQAKGIVSINLEEKPKKKKIKKHLFVENDVIAEKSIKGDFDKEPIQNIKPVKKVHYKPLVSEIQEEKGVKIEDIQKEIENQKKLLELKIKESKEEEIRLKKELKLKKKAEKKERKRNRWYRRIFRRKKKEIKQEVREVSNPNEIKLIEANDIIPKLCPICSAKIKKQKVIQEYGTFRQIFKCKKCPFQKEIIVKL